MSSIKMIMHNPDTGQELFPHNFADQTWVGAGTFDTVPHNLINPSVFHSWGINADGSFRDGTGGTGYIEDGALYTADSLDEAHAVGVLVSVDAEHEYIVKYTNRFTGLTGVVHWLDSHNKELSHVNFAMTGRTFTAPKGAVYAAIGWFGLAAINTRVCINFGVLTKLGTSVQNWIDGVIDGSITVGNADNLDHHDSTFFYFRTEAEKLISDLNDGTFIVNNSHHLGGKDISYFATKSEFDVFVDQVLNGGLTVDNSNKLGGIDANEYLLDINAVKVYHGNSAPGNIPGAKLNDIYIQLKQ